MMRAIFSAGPLPAGVEPPVQWWARRTIEGLLTSAQRHGEIAAEVDIGYWGEALLVLLHPFTLYNQRTQHDFSNERITAGLTRIVDAVFQ
jgi:hypothetical protein